MKIDGHFKISMVKSALRILAGISLIRGGIGLAGVCFILAEGLGILEEMV